MTRLKLGNIECLAYCADLIGYRYGSLESDGTVWVFKEMPQIHAETDDELINIWFESDCAIQIKAVEPFKEEISQLYEIEFI